jgi:hypothetical protein
MPKLYLPPKIAPKLQAKKSKKTVDGGWQTAYSVRVSEKQNKNRTKTNAENMKTLKQILLTAVALCAVSAQAYYTYSVTEGNSSIPDIGTQYVTPGQSGVTTFNFTMVGAPGDNTTTWASVNDAFGHIGQYKLLTYDAGIFSSATFNVVASTLVTGAGKTFTEGTIYTAVVDWTISALAPYSSAGNLTFGFAAHTPNGGGLGGNTTDWVQQTVTAYTTTAPVPEPAQVLASSMLFGIGGLFFVGRRMIKKQAQ